MPKAEVGTPKWLSNKMKSKGLQRLRWYCQMCEKQCRDENGFKCHMNSESHLRMMQVFSQCSGKFIDDFSRAFEADFMRLMRTRYCRARVLANSVYCEMISNKDHVHMNATAWVTLNGFLRHLEQSGQLKVDWPAPGDPSQRGPYITYIDRERELKEQAAKDRLKKYISPEELEDQRLKALIEEQQQLAAAPLDTTVPTQADGDGLAPAPVHMPSAIVLKRAATDVTPPCVKPTKVASLFKPSKKKSAS